MQDLFFSLKNVLKNPKVSLTQVARMFSRANRESKHSALELAQTKPVMTTPKTPAFQSPPSPPQLLMFVKPRQANMQFSLKLFSTSTSTESSGMLERTKKALEDIRSVQAPKVRSMYEGVAKGVEVALQSTATVAEELLEITENYETKIKDLNSQMEENQQNMRKLQREIEDAKNSLKASIADSKTEAQNVEEELIKKLNEELQKAKEIMTEFKKKMETDATQSSADLLEEHKRKLIEINLDMAKKLQDYKDQIQKATASLKADVQRAENTLKGHIEKSDLAINDLEQHVDAAEKNIRKIQKKTEEDLSKLTKDTTKDIETMQETAAEIEKRSKKAMKRARIALGIAILCGALTVVSALASSDIFEDEIIESLEWLKRLPKPSSSIYTKLETLIDNLKNIKALKEKVPILEKSLQKIEQEYKAQKQTLASEKLQLACYDLTLQVSQEKDRLQSKYNQSFSGYRAFSLFSRGYAHQLKILALTALEREMLSLSETQQAISWQNISSETRHLIDGAYQYDCSEREDILFQNNFLKEGLQKNKVDISEASGSGLSQAEREATPTFSATPK